MNDTEATPSTCQYRIADGDDCELASQPDNEFCILHNPDPDKDKELFQQTLDAELRRQEESAEVEEIDLSGVHFVTPFEWIEKHVRKRITFDNANFHQGASFWKTEFHQNVMFESAKFHQDAHFDYAKFHQDAWFYNAEFHRYAWFLNAKFHQLASFDNTEFHRDAWFEDTEFQQDALFFNASFERNATFLNTEFNSNPRTEFTGAVVSERLWFHGSKFAEHDQKGNCELEFRQVVIKPDAEIIFEDVDLSRTSFLRTDLSRVRFRGDVRWAISEERPWWMGRAVRRNALYDQLKLEKIQKGEATSTYREFPSEGETPTPHLVGELYRQLRLNFEQNRQEIEAGAFYIGQMDMRRMEQGRFGAVGLGIYRFVALYGESFQRPILLYFVLGMCFAVGYLLAGFDAVGNSTIHYDGGFKGATVGQLTKDFLQALTNALTAGGILREKLDFESWWGPPLRYLNTLVDVVLLTVTIVALRRRFKR